MTGTAKKIHGALSFIPLLVWFLWCGYILIITRNLIFTQTFQDHDKVVTAIANHYSEVMALWAIGVAVTFVMLIYNVVHLARIKNMHGGNKLAWMIFMVAFGPVSFPVFWYIQVRNEPKNLQYYADIA